MGQNRYDAEAKKVVQVFATTVVIAVIVLSSGGLLAIVATSLVSSKTIDADVFGVANAAISKDPPVFHVSSDSLVAASAKDSQVVEKPLSAQALPATRKPISTAEKVAIKKVVDSVSTNTSAIVRKRRVATKNSQIEREVLSAIEAGIKRYPVIEERYGEMISRHCSPKGIDPDIGIATVAVESQGYSGRSVVSNKGARGLWQLMPKTGYRLAKIRGIKGSWGKIVDTLLFDPEIATMLGTDHLKESWDFYGDPVKMVIAYEAGDVGAFYQYQRFGKSLVDVPYYRKVFGVYQYIKASKGLPLDPAMKIARLPDDMDPSLALAID